MVLGTAAIRSHPREDQVDDQTTAQPCLVGARGVDDDRGARARAGDVDVVARERRARRRARDRALEQRAPRRAGFAHRDPEQRSGDQGRHRRDHGRRAGPALDRPDLRAALHARGLLRGRDRLRHRPAELGADRRGASHPVDLRRPELRHSLRAGELGAVLQQGAVPAGRPRPRGSAHDHRRSPRRRPQDRRARRRHLWLLFLRRLRRLQHLHHRAPDVGD